MQSGMCPKNDAAAVILSKDPYCGAHHLSGDACEARWKAYWFEPPWAREAAVSHLGEHRLRSRRPHQRIAAGASKKVLDVQGWIGCFRKALCV
jgi:hypothetical protein